MSHTTFIRPKFTFSLTFFLSQSLKSSTLPLPHPTGYLMMEDTSEFSQFHALSILHYVIVKHWTSTFMTESMHDEVRSYIFSLLNARISQFLDDSTNLGNFSYICGKLFQVHVSLWKCSWLQCERAEIAFFLQSIQSLVLPSGGGSINTADVVSTKKTKAGTIYLC